MNAEAATATILFTDLAGSTELRGRLGEERADELRRFHDRLLGEAVGTHGGTVVKSMGDGLMAAFPSAVGALDAAVAIQQAAHAYSRSAGALAALRVHVGVSTGDVSWEDGDCFGAPVVEAARLEATAEPGQILCSEFVRLMARGRGGHAFEPVGFLELKGLPDLLAACSVVWAPRAGGGPAISLPLPPELSAMGPRLIGRRAELESGARSLTEGTSALWLLGEPGIGKTRLAAELARRAHTDGAAVLFGRCSRDLAVPYEPFIECLRFLLAHSVDDRLGELLGADGAELTRLTPELAKRLPGGAAPSSGGGDGERYLLFEAVRAWVTATAAQAPLVLVLDDLQWATDATIALLGHILRRPCGESFAVLGTARTTAPDLNPAFAELIDDLDAAGLTTALALSGLSAEELVNVAGGAEQAERLHEQSGGNPLFVEVIRRAGIDGARRDDLAAAVRRRVGRLPPEVGQLLGQAAVAGLRVDLRVLASAAGVSEAAALAALDTAEAAGLMHAIGANAYHWVHDLVREALAGQLNEARAARVHAGLAHAIEAVHRGALDDHAAALAHHWYAAREVTGTVPALQWALAAARRADAQLSFQEEAQLYARAAELATTPTERVRHRLAQGWALDVAGEFRSARAAFVAAGDEAQMLGLAVLALEAAIGYEQASAEGSQSGQEALGRLQAALALPGDLPAPLRARATAALGRAFGFSGRFEDATAAGHEAIALARRVGDPTTTLRTLMAACWVAGARHLPGKEHHDLAREAMALLDRSQVDHHLRTETLMQGWIAACWSGDPDLLADVERRAAALRHLGSVPFHHMIFSIHAAGLALCEGRFSDAEVAFEAAFAAHQRSRAEGDGLFAERRFFLLREQGRLGELLPALHVLRRLAPASAPVWQPGAAALYASLGLEAEARAELAAVAADDFAALALDGARIVHLSFIVDAVLALREHRLAPRLRAELAPLAGRGLVWLGPGFALGSADRQLGALAALAGDDAEADAHFAAAVAFDTRMGWPVWLARDHLEWSTALERRDPTAAAVHLTTARELADRHGLVGVSSQLARG